MSAPSAPHSKPFLGVNFKSCGAYGRLYKNKDETAYIGRCPRCGKPIRVPIGQQGTNKRFFEAFCN